MTEKRKDSFERMRKQRSRREIKAAQHASLKEWGERFSAATNMRNPWGWRPEGSGDQGLAV